MQKAERPTLGTTIRERTRALLGWDESAATSFRHHPYQKVRVRRLSGGSTCSSDCSQPSPCSISSLPESPHPAMRSTRDVQVFERLRHLVSVLPTDKNAFQIIVDTVSQVMDLEHHLEELEEKTIDYKSTIKRESPVIRTYYAAPQHPEAIFPDDLANVDVSAFKHLVYSQPVHIDPRFFQ
uniref:Uncharacterized protein n=1 Tax=Heterorhabditis bacteriophora TaxID=37862 RepID=A0A1I7XPW6_HETBA